VKALEYFNKIRQIDGREFPKTRTLLEGLESDPHALIPEIFTNADDWTVNVVHALLGTPQNTAECTFDMEGAVIYLLATEAVA
tara:strand:- start:160 stop:408 length:249 start_codon:yes stop_codon:yes gene_type:complete